MGHRFEAVPDSSIRNVGKDEKKQKPKSRPSSYRGERFDEHNDPQCDEVFELAMLLEKSEICQALKSLLLAIITSDRCEELIPFLKERSTDMDRLKKKQLKANIDERPKRQPVRRSSKSGRSELSEQGTGSGQRKSIRTRLTEKGSRTDTQSVSTRLNHLRLPPSTSLRSSRQSDSCLRKANRDTVIDFPNQKSRLTSSSSLLQLRTNRRSDVSRRRKTISLNHGETQAFKANESWDPVPSALTNNKHRLSMDSVLKLRSSSLRINNGNKDSTLSPTCVSGIDKSQDKMLGKIIIDKSFNLGDNDNGLSDDSDGEDEKSSQKIHNSKLLNSFAQFEPTGQVAYREQTVRLHDLVDDLRSNIDSNREPKREDTSLNIEANDDTMPQKKGLRKYLTRQLSNENYRSFSDENKFVIKGLNDSFTSKSLQRSITS